MVTNTAVRSDRTRQLAVTVSEVICIIGTMVGVGVFGGPPVAQAAGGALSADATLIAPATQAFSIWSVIYLGLAVYTVWQWLPGQTSSARHRRIGWPAAASMLLNAAWLLVVQAGWLWVSVPVILALVVVLGVIIGRLAGERAGSTADAVIVDGTFGLYVGWVSVAVCANITAALVDSGVQPAKLVSEIAAVVVLLVAAAVGVLLARVSRGNLAIGAALGWGLVWVAVARAGGQPQSTITAIAAAIAAAIVVAACVVLRMRTSRRVPVPA